MRALILVLLNRYEPRVGLVYVIVLHGIPEEIMANPSVYMMGR